MSIVSFRMKSPMKTCKNLYIWIWSFMKLFECTHRSPGNRPRHLFGCQYLCVFVRFERVVSKDYQLGEYLIPKGMLICVPVYPIHHDPHVWHEPGKFIPERYISNFNDAFIDREYL